MLCLTGFFNLDLRPKRNDDTSSSKPFFCKIEKSVFEASGAKSSDCESPTFDTSYFAQTEPKTLSGHNKKYGQLSSPHIDVFWLGRPSINNLEEFSISVKIFYELQSFEEILVQAQNFRGPFVLVVWNKITHELHIIRDQIGHVPLYYTQKNNKLYFSTHIKKLLTMTGPPIEIDKLGVADALSPGLSPFANPTRTPFKNIFNLPPAHTLSYADNKNLQILQYWDFNELEPIRHKSYQDYCEHFKFKFTEVLDRVFAQNEQVGLLLSGGLDSSAIYCLAMSKYPNQITGIHYRLTDPLANETPYIKLLEEFWQKPVLSFTPDLAPESYQQHLTTHIQAVEAPSPDHLLPATHQAMQMLVEQGCNTLLSGHFGDQVLFSPFVLSDQIKQFNLQGAWSNFTGWRDWLGPDIANQYLKLAAKDLIKGIAPNLLHKLLLQRRLKLQQESYLNPKLTQALLQEQGLDLASSRPKQNALSDFSSYQKALYYQIRCKYHVQCLEWNFKNAESSQLFYYSPFMDVELLSFLFSIPGEMQSHQGKPRSLVRDALTGLLPEAIRQRRDKADFSQSIAHPAHAFQTASHEAHRLGLLNTNLSSREISPWEDLDMLGLEIWLSYFNHFCAANSYDKMDEQLLLSNEKREETL